MKTKFLAAVLLLGAAALAYASDPVSNIYPTQKLIRITDATSAVSISTPTLGSSLAFETKGLAKCNILLAPRLSVSGATVAFKVLYWSSTGDFETTSEIFSVTAGTESISGSYHAPGILVDSLGAGQVSIQVTTAPSSGTVTFFGKAY